MNVQFNIRIASAPAEQQQVFELRHQIFVVEQGISDGKEREGNDADSIHVMAVDEQGDVVGTGRLNPMPNAEGVVARIGVMKAYRGKGLANDIVRFIEHVAINQKMRRLTLKPHDFLHDFYASLGYRKFGEQEHIGSHVLLNMEKDIG